MKTMVLLIATLTAALMMSCSGDSSKKNAAAGGGVNANDYPNEAGKAFGRWRNQDLTAMIAKDKITLQKSCKDQANNVVGTPTVTSSARVTENTIEVLDTKEDKLNEQCGISVNPGTIRYYMMNYNNKEMLVVSGDNGDIAFERIP